MVECENSTEMEKKTITTLAGLGSIAEIVLSLCAENGTAQVIALSGDLGAGKTAFVKELAKILKIPHEVTSPTFVIMKSYKIEAHPFLKTLTHIDAYRIESDEEMRVLGFSELLTDATRLVCIEWPEKIQNLIPQDAIKIALTLNNDGTRVITYDT